MRNIFVENHKNLSDDDIIARISDGDYELLQVMIERYYPLILNTVQKYCPKNYKEDAIQEATLALYSAIKGYDSSKSSFSTFAALCIKRSVISVLKSSKRQKNIPDELIDSIEEYENLTDANSPEKIFFDRVDYKDLKDIIKLELSKLEYEVLQLYLVGDKYSDIAVKLGISEKSVNNALTRIRKKLKR